MNGYRKSPAYKPLKAQAGDFLCPEDRRGILLMQIYDECAK